MTGQRTLLTSEEFFRIYGSKEGRYELVKGEVVEMAPPGGVHGGIAINIGGELRTFVRQHDLGRVVAESGFLLERGPDTVRAPDVAFVRKDRIPEGGLPRGFIDGAPDLAVEIVSPSDTAADLERKVHDYLRHGTQQVWVVYPDTHRVAVHLPDGSARWYEEGTSLEATGFLPGFSLTLQEVFGD